jgi:hypothetical protein
MARDTILEGCTGDSVRELQGVLGIPVTGIFDTETEQALMDFQSKKGLPIDGVVTPEVWAVLLGRADFGDEFGAEQGATAQARGTAKPADANAYKVAQRAGAKLTEAERQYVLAVARGEGYYGLGWKPGEGAGSHNWGAVQGVGPAGSFQHLDHHADGTPYHTAFKAYHNDDEGFQDMARILLKPNVKAALNGSGSLHDAVYAQHSNHYFELDPKKYLAAVVKNYNTLAATGMFKPLLSENGRSVSLLGTAVVAFLGVAGGRYAYRKFQAGKKGPRK